MGQEEKSRERILKIAREEFLEMGFRNASLRRIAKEAGVTTGSLYWHFQNKEELFKAIVGEHYEHILHMYQDSLERFFAMPPEKQKDHMGDIGAECMEAMLEYMYLHKPEFKILLTGAAGTKYDNMLHELTEAEIRSTHEFARHLSGLGIESKETSPELEHILVRSMFAGLLELITLDVPLEVSRKCVHGLHAFYTAGWRYLLNVPE